MAKKKRGSFRNRGAIKAGQKESKNKLGDFTGEALDAPQKALMKGTVGVYAKPSEIVDQLYKQEYPNANLKDHKYARAMTDIAVDPLNALGMLKFGKVGLKGNRILSPADKIKKTGIKATGLYDNVGEVVEKMAFGGSVQDPMTDYLNNQHTIRTNRPNYIQSPNETLAENNIALARAMSASNTGLTKALDVIGSTAMSTGMDMMSQGLFGGSKPVENMLPMGTSGFIDPLTNGILPTVDMPSIQPVKFAMGGNVPGTPVEVEGQEVAQLPNGQMLEFQGPSHEQGGMPMNLPAGTDVYSKRIKDTDGKTMAKRKKQRVKNLDKLEKKSKGNGTDALLKNSLKRTKQVNNTLDALDQMIQEQIAAAVQPQQEPQQFAFGGIIPGIGDDEIIGLEEAVIKSKLKPMDMPTHGMQFPMATPDFVPMNTLQKVTDGHIKNAPMFQKPSSDTWGKIQEWGSEQLKDLPTGGDVLGMWGNLKQAYDPYNTTLQSRATDTPNVNMYKDFGKNALKTIDGMKDFATQSRDAQLKTLQEQASATSSANRSTARGINTLRALDIATDANKLNAMNQVHSQFAQQMMGILGQQAQAETQQDQVVMGGEAAADLANRQDKGAFYTQVARDQQAIGEGISRTGKSINDIKERNVNNDFLNMLSDYIDIDTKTGRITQKDNADISRDGATNSPGKQQGNKEEVSGTDYQYYKNPETGKAFSSKKEWDAYNKKRNENKYLDAPEELDTSYKNFIDPTTNTRFAFRKDYELFTKTGKTANQYLGQDLYKGNTFYKNLPASEHGEAKNLLGQYLLKNNLNNFNIDSKDDIKKLEKMLGLKETGHFGKGVFTALKKALK